MFRLIIRLTFILIYLLNNIGKLIFNLKFSKIKYNIENYLYLKKKLVTLNHENNCYDTQMKLERSKFYLNNFHNRILFIDSGNLKISNYKFTNSFNLKINYKTTIKNMLGQRFYYGLNVKDNWMFEGLEKKLSLLVLNNIENNIKRYMFDKSNCRLRSSTNYRYRLSNYYRNIDEKINNDHHKYLSFLFNFCSLNSRNTDLHVLKSDNQELMIIQLNSIGKKDLLLTIKPSFNQTNARILSIDHVIFNQTNNLFIQNVGNLII